MKPRYEILQVEKSGCTLLLLINGDEERRVWVNPRECSVEAITKMAQQYLDQHVAETTEPPVPDDVLALVTEPIE